MRSKTSTKSRSRVPVKGIKILGKTYAVSGAESLHADGRIGQHSSNKLEMKYCTEQAEEQCKDTMLHESIHAIDYILQLGLREKQVHCLSAGLLEMLKANPKFTRWLLN